MMADVRFSELFMVMSIKLFKIKHINLQVILINAKAVYGKPYN